MKKEKGKKKNCPEREGTVVSVHLRDLIVADRDKKQSFRPYRMKETASHCPEFCIENIESQKNDSDRLKRRLIKPETA